MGGGGWRGLVGLVVKKVARPEPSGAGRLSGAGVAAPLVCFLKRKTNYVMDRFLESSHMMERQKKTVS